MAPTTPALLAGLPRQPHELNECFARAFNTGEREQSAQFFAPQAQLVAAQGPVRTGLAAIRAELAGYLRLRGTMRIANRSAVRFAEYALLYSDWEVSYGAGSAATTLRGWGVEVGRQQAGGTWRFVVDHPFVADASRG